ncbi:hypothetical protein [Sporisorium scitamineum]|uniref:Uncharacterized protein n=1 Tax=Sporisorium scitamineum TaxID=49012 RepID=A0A0F7SBZ8_9BASI|nr:hypothetical protein [Sporisorium scitamineum]
MTANYSDHIQAKSADKWNNRWLGGRERNSLHVSPAGRDKVQGPR